MKKPFKKKKDDSSKEVQIKFRAEKALKNRIDKRVNELKKEFPDFKVTLNTFLSAAVERYLKLN